jgi:hypothetical protein
MGIDYWAAKFGIFVHITVLLAKRKGKSAVAS